MEIIFQGQVNAGESNPLDSEFFNSGKNAKNFKITDVDLAIDKKDGVILSSYTRCPGHRACHNAIQAGRPVFNLWSDLYSRS
jgi:hypothetical protein